MSLNKLLKSIWCQLPNKKALKYLVPNNKSTQSIRCQITKARKIFGANCQFFLKVFSANCQITKALEVFGAKQRKHSKYLSSFS